LRAASSPGAANQLLCFAAARVTVAEGAPRTVQPGEAWFDERARAGARGGPAERETSFIRVSITAAASPRSSSILYLGSSPTPGVAVPAPQRVYVDERSLSERQCASSSLTAIYGSGHS